MLPGEPPGEHDEGGANFPASIATAGELFGLVVTTDALASATSDRAWLLAMLRFEAALARAEADLGVVPGDAAQDIERCCYEAWDDLTPAALGRRGRLSGNPAVPFVAELRSRLPAGSARWAHFGATSQDVLDSALMLVAREVLDIVLADLGRLATAAAGLAERHRRDVLPARTLLQHAAPTTFGVKAAGWLVAALEAAEALGRLRRERLSVQLGGPAGTLAALGPRGPGVVEELARGLGLHAPVLPWHTNRLRVVELAGALTASAGVAAKVALDVALLMQTEVSEAFEPAAPGRGGSSSLPQKRNPAMASTVTAAWRQAQGAASVVVGAMAQEHERAAGAWQAEHQAFSLLARSAGGAVAVAADILTGLEVDTARMEADVGLTRGLLLAERVTLALSAHLPEPDARRIVEEASRQAAVSGTDLEGELKLDPQVAGALSKMADDVFDPAGWVGLADVFVERALAYYQEAKEVA